MNIGSKFWVKVYRPVPMMDNPLISCGFILEETEELWIARRVGDKAVLGWNPDRKEFREFLRSAIREVEE